MDARFSDGTYVNDTRLDPGVRKAYVDLGGNWLPRTQAVSLNYALSQVIFTESGSFDWVLQGQTRGTHYETVYNGNGKRLVEKAPTCTVDQLGDATQCWDPAEDVDANYMATAANPTRLNDVVPTYTTVNVGIGWKHPDGRLSIRGYVNNALDVTYATFIGSTGGNNIRFYNDQRTGGVTVRVDW
jgi:outer membrane receptor protein involved in Fe transport